MAGNNDIVFPPKGRALFDGGLNSKFERSIIEDNESPDCLNVVFANGAVETRMGSSKLNTAAIGSFVCDGIYTRRDNTTAETMIVFAGGTAWQLGVTSFTTIASAQSVFSAGLRVGTTQYENHMFIGNGSVTPYKYNGAHFTRHGVPRGVMSGTTGAVSGGGSMTTGTYYYKFSDVNSALVEGDVSTATTGFAITTTTGAVNLTGIAVAPTSHGVNARRVYRASAPAGVYGLVGTIANNTATTYSDTSALETTVAPTDNGEPPVYSVACQHQGRVFMNDTANPGYIWWSNIFEPYTVASTNFQPVGDQTRDLVKSIDVYDNSILIGCENSMHLLFMPTTDPADWSVIRIRTQYGSKSPFANFLFDNKVMFGAMQNDKFVGFAAISGSSIDPVATSLDISTAGSDLHSDRIEPDMFDVQETYVKNISAMVYKNKAYIAVTDGANNTTNNRIYIFDFSRSNLSKKQKSAWSPMEGVNAAQFCIYGGNLYAGSATANGFVYKLEAAAYSDDSTAINSYFWTKEFAGLKGHENLEKDFRRINLLVEMVGTYFMGLTHRVDSDAGTGVTKQVSLDSGATAWPFIWGAVTWGGGPVQKEIPITLGRVSGKRLQLKFSNQNTAAHRFKVLGLNFVYNLKGKR